MSQLEPVWKFGASESHVSPLDKTASAYDLRITAPLVKVIWTPTRGLQPVPGLEFARSILLLLNSEDESIFTAIRIISRTKPKKCACIRAPASL